MSRVAKAPVTLPNGVDVIIKGQHIEVKGAKGTLSTVLHDLVAIKNENGVLSLSPREATQTGWMQTGTARAVVNNLVTGVSAGFERKLQLVGVGYKAQAKGKVLGYRPPEPYKGKGVRYVGENILRKEAKKK